MTEEDINEVEAFVRNEMSDIVFANNEEKDDGSTAVVVQKQKMIDHFGELYALQPEKFRFQPGDRKFIKLIQQTVTEAIEEKGRKRAMQHFGYKCAPSKRTALNENQNGHINTDNAICSATDADLVIEMKSKLFVLALAKLKTLAAPNNYIDVFTDSFVSVDTTDSQILQGGIVCSLGC